MFNRIYHEFQFQTLRLGDCNNSASSSSCSANGGETTSSALITSAPATASQQGNIEEITAENSTKKFTDVMQIYEEKFIMVSQGHKSLFLDLRLNELINFFSVPICARFDGRTRCSKDCECRTSIEIGTHLYEKGCLHSFHQIGNYIVGSIVEQHTDPLTRIAVKFDSSMQTIKTIHCPCKLYFCPHAVALLMFRIKLRNFYAIKLPMESKLMPVRIAHTPTDLLSLFIQVFQKNIPQSELVKFYGFFVEESRSLPIIKDYHSRCWNTEQSLKQKHLQTPYIYAFCHKNLLPIDYAILEEQTRARKWISDLYMKRNSQSSLSGMTPLPNAGEIFLLGNSMKNHDKQEAATAASRSSSSSSLASASTRHRSSNSSSSNKNSFKKYN